MTVDKSAQRIRKMFGEISPRYDLLNHLLSGGVDYYWRWWTVRHVPPAGTAPILDVCTGTGDLALAYWRAGRGRVPVIGSDFTHPMLVRARHKAARYRTSSRAALEFCEADTLHLPFADDQFQIVSVAFGLRNVVNTLRGVEEMVRVCQPGGRVAILEFSLPRRPWLRRLYQWYFRKILPRLGQWLTRNRQAAYEYLPQSVAEFPQDAALAALLEAAGLREVTWTPLTLGIATLYRGRKPLDSPGQPSGTAPVP